MREFVNIQIPNIEPQLLITTLSKRRFFNSKTIKMSINKQQILELLYNESKQENSGSSVRIIEEEDFDYLAEELLKKFTFTP